MKINLNCVIIVFVGLICNSFGKLAPDFIHPCDSIDNKCFMKATQEAIPYFTKGIPEFNMQSLDPLMIDVLPVPFSGINITLFDSRLIGIKRCVVDDIKTDVQEHFKIDLHCSPVTLKGKYRAVGSYVLFNVDGEGDSKIKISNIKISMDISLSLKKDENGLNHIHVKQAKSSYSFEDRVTFDMKNLFKNSQQLSDAILQFLNENWKLVANEMGKPITDYVINTCVQTIAKFFEAVPNKELIHVPELY